MIEEVNSNNQANYLIPANSKRGLLIMGSFYIKDLILFGSGVLLTVIILILFEPGNLPMIIVTILPALITGLLVMPIPNYHNTLTVILSIINFYSKREKFKWEGWSFYEETNSTK
ncbi:MAG: hypothetical protein WDA21_02370 [Bacilli bacterium]